MKSGDSGFTAFCNCLAGQLAVFRLNLRFFARQAIQFQPRRNAADCPPERFEMHILRPVGMEQRRHVLLQRPRRQVFQHRISDFQHCLQPIRSFSFHLIRLPCRIRKLPTLSARGMPTGRRFSASAPAASSAPCVSQRDDLPLARLLQVERDFRAVGQHNVSADPVGIMREIRAEDERHCVHRHVAPEVDAAPRVFPRADAPASERPLAVIIVAMQPVDGVARTEACLVARFDIRSDMGEEVRFAAQIRRIAGNIAPPIDFLSAVIGRAVMTCRFASNAPDAYASRCSPAGTRHVMRPFGRYTSPGSSVTSICTHRCFSSARDFHRVAVFIGPVNAQARIICTLCRGNQRSVRRFYQNRNPAVPFTARALGRCPSASPVPPQGSNRHR